MRKLMWFEIGVLIVVLIALVAGVGNAGEKACGVGTESINLQQVQVGAISSNLNVVTTNGGAGSVGSSSSFQSSGATGQIIYDPVVRVDTSTFGSTVAASKGNAVAGGENHGTAWGNATILNLYRSFGR
jgi:hypothetical protein